MPNGVDRPSLTSPLRVVQTIASLRRGGGGPSRTVTALCRELGRLGIQVELISQFVTGSAADNYLLPPADLVTTTLVSAYRLPLVGKSWSRSFRAVLHKRCEHEQSRLIHDNGLWLPTNHSAAVVARKLGIPLIISTHGMLEPWALNHRAWKKQLAWRFYQQCDLRTARVLHATAPHEAESLRRHGLRQPIAVIPNGVELPELTETAQVSRSGQIAVDVASARRTALFLGRIHPVKGLLALVDAWGIVRPAGWRMVIAGPDEGGHRAVVEARLSANGLTEQFTFVGPIDGPEKAALYRSAALFVLPTFSENFGVVVAEALAHGLPVITTHGAPWADLPVHDCGWWIPIGVAPLAEALRAAMALSDTDRADMGARGLAYVRRYDWAAIAEDMAAVYRWVLGRGERPDCVRMD